jgi:hypothetical protein
VSVHPSRALQECATFAVATLPELRSEAGPVDVHGPGERLAREAAAYLNAVDFFRVEGAASDVGGG